MNPNNRADAGGSFLGWNIGGATGFSWDDEQSGYQGEGAPWNRWEVNHWQSHSCLGGSSDKGASGICVSKEG